MHSVPKRADIVSKCTFSVESIDVAELAKIDRCVPYVASKDLNTFSQTEILKTTSSIVEFL